MRWTIALASTLLLFSSLGTAEAQDIERARRLLPPDGIRSIDEPQFRKTASFLNDDDEVLGVIRDGKARAYPLLILNAHEICNDVLGRGGVSVTW